MASCAAWLNEVKFRSGTTKPSALDVNEMASVPKKRARTNAADPLNVEWPLVYDGKGGVPIRGVQAASPTVSGLPSLSPSRIPVTGRQYS